MSHWTVNVKGGPGEPAYAVVLVKQKVYYFGGRCDFDTAPTNVAVFNTVPLRWEKFTPSTGTGKHYRIGHTAVLVGDTVFLWGGKRKGNYYSELYAFDVDDHRWFKPPRVSGTFPAKRYYHSACVLEKVMFIYGGYTNLKRYRSLYKLDTSTMVWALINTIGTRLHLSAHSSTIIGTNMFVFGGQENQEFHDRIRVFDTKTNVWKNTSSAQLLPKRRCGHAAFTYNGELYIFGGWDGNQTLNDMWKFSPENFSWTEVKPKGKGPCPMYGMCCCIVGDHIILFGGKIGDGTIADELFILDLSPSLKTLCKLVVSTHSIEGESELPHSIRWELAAMRAI